MADTIVNKVANSGLITIDLAEWYKETKVFRLDLKPILWNEMALREKDLRDYLAGFDYSSISGQYVNVFCSVDIIIPQWSYLLISSAFSPFTKNVIWGDINPPVNEVLQSHISTLNTAEYKDKRVVIKGCSEYPIAPTTYIALVSKLQPVVKSIMYGEPCSTVPIYKKKT